MTRARRVTVHTVKSRSSGSSTFVRFRSFDSSHDNPLDLPDSSHSIAALEFIGFTAETASEFLVWWTSRLDQDDYPDDLIDYVLAHFLRLFSPLFTNAEYDGIRSLPRLPRCLH